MHRNIRNTIACLTAIAGIFLVAPQASAYSDAPQYVGIQAAYTDVTYHNPLNSGTSVVATYGLGLPKVHELLGVELEYTESTNDPDYNTSSYKARFEYYTVAGYAVMTIPVKERVSLRARAGLVHETWEYHNNVLGNETHSNYDFSIGGGAIYSLNEYLNLIAEITIIESNIIHGSAGAQFKF